MRKLSRSAYEDTKGLVRAAETLLEVVVMTLLYYGAFRKGYEIEHFVYKGKYVLMGIYGALLYVMFLNSDCTLFGQLHRLDLIIGQVISLFVVNFLTYFQLCLIANTMIAVGPMLLLLLAEIVVAVVLIYVYTELYYKLYAPHDMLLVYGNKRGIGLKIKMDSRRDKYNVSKLMSIDEGLEAVCQETRRHDAVILTDIPAQIRNDILKYCYRYRIRTYVAPKLTDIMLRGAKNNTLFDTPLLMVKGTGLTPVQRIIKRAEGGDKTEYEAITYEGYGPGGIAVMVETLTDNRNRTAANMRHYFDKFGGNLGQMGCVGFMFTQKGVIVVDLEDADPDQLMMDALDAGAEDFDAGEEAAQVTTDPDNFTAVCNALEEKGYKFISADVAQVPSTTTALTDPDQLVNMGKLLDALDDDDDVQNAWTTLENEEDLDR